MAAGKRLEYACFGPPPSEAPTLVLLHEGLGCVRLWRDFPKALAEASGLGVFVYSRAGYGQSDPVELPRPLDYMTREAVDVLPEILATIDARHVILIGHSDGATITAIHTGRIADPRVNGAVLIAPHFFTEVAGLAEIAKAREAFDAGELRARLGKYHKDPDIAFRGWSEAWLDANFKAWNVATLLNDIGVPVLAIQGREDPYGTLAQIDAVSHRCCRAPVSTLILNGCQHAPHLEHSARVISAITSFCQHWLPGRYTTAT